MNPLQCVECGRVWRENERGWTARLTVDDEVVLSCSECDKRVRRFLAGSAESAIVRGRWGTEHRTQTADSIVLSQSLVSLVRSLRARSAPTTKIAVTR
jgi:hypothetical protein